jgi:hypothetical protein
MRTVIELGKDGSRTIFHRSGQKAWAHPEGDPHVMETKSRRVPVKHLCPGCPKDAGHSVEERSEGKDTREFDDNALTSGNAKRGTAADQALWDRGSPDGLKEYERARKARKRAAYKATSA